MGDQHLHVENVKARNLTIAPVQQNFGVSGDGVRGWTEALLRGPLERADQARRAEEAEKAASEQRPGDAAEGYLAIAAALAGKDFGPAADIYRTRAAAALAEAGQKERASALYMELARESLHDGDLTAVTHARHAREHASPESAWEADALLAQANWPEQEQGDVEALRRAWEKSDGQPGEAEWAAALVELLLLNGERQEALQVARDVSERLPLAPGPRLRLELDLLDLSEGPEDDELLESSWQRLLVWAQNPELPIEASAAVLQRRGVALTRRGDREAARTAFLGATQAWSREPRFNDQAAEAFFSAISAGLALGDISSAFDDALPVARSMRGPERTTTSRTERLELRGLRALVQEKHPDSLRQLASAHNLARRAGNLSDFFQVTGELGDLYLASKRPLFALESFVQVGDTSKAKMIGQDLSVDEVLAAVPLDGALWERTAAWAAVAGAGRVVSEEGAATVAEAALAELEREPPFGFPPNPSFHAAEALAGVICAVPELLLSRSLEVLRERLRRGAGDPKRLAEPFLLISLVGRADEADILLEALLDSELQPSVPLVPLVELIEGRPELQQRVIEAAKDGDGTALDVAGFAGLLSEDEELLERAREGVRAALEGQPREVSEENGMRTVTFGIGTSLAPVGTMATHCEEPLRHAFAQKMVGIVTDPEELPIMTRVAAVEGLHNLAPALPEGVAEEVIAALSSRAEREDEPTDFDRVGVGDPLARFKIDMAPPDALQAAALEALARVAQNAPSAIFPLTKGIVAALGSGRDPLLIAAVRALTLNPELGVPGFEAGQLLAHQNEAIRIATLDLLSRNPSEGLRQAGALLNDPSPRVRFGLIGLAIRVEGGQELLEALARDPDSYTRATARARLGR